MAQELSHPTRSEMPEIVSPNSLGMEAFYELAKDGFNAVAYVSEETRPGLFLAFGRSIRSEKIQALNKTRKVIR